MTLPSRTVEHDALVAAVRRIAGVIERDDVTNAFLAGLVSRRFEHWSSLVSHTIARTLPDHRFAAPDDGRRCRICGAYARVDAFASDEFATRRTASRLTTDSLRYTLFDLERFGMEAPSPPTAADVALYDAAIARIERLPAAATASDAERALGVCFPSRLDRKYFLGVLGVCGALAAPGRPGFRDAFVAFEDRCADDPAPYAYPVAFWRRSFGIDADACRPRDQRRGVRIATTDEAPTSRRIEASSEPSSAPMRA